MPARKPDPPATVEDIHAAVAAASSPERAKTNAWFFKTGPGQYGEGDHFAGLALAQVHAIAKANRGLPLADIPALLASAIHEERQVALDILVARFGRADLDERRQIFDLYMANTSRVNNWDLVDGSAPQIVGGFLEGSSSLLDRLAASLSLWERRIAMVGTHHYIRAGDPAPALRIATLLLYDRHDLIQKAVGWMLREVGKRCGRQHLTAFLDQHAATMPRTALRYALEHFDPAERSRYMTMKCVS